jgi:hypothetical protein
VRLTSPTDDFVPYLAEHLKEWDRTEVGLVFPNWPIEAVIHYSINTSDVVHFAEADGKPIAVSGYGDGCGWMLSTPAIENHKKAFLKLSKELLSVYAQFGDGIGNNIHKNNKRTIRWLSHLGFSIEGETGDGFYKMGRKLCTNM